jgi:IclR family pca regulon transcriptional regulator
LSEVARATGLPRPTARRILITLEVLGYVRVRDGRFTLTPRVLDLGYAYVSSFGLWDVARPHLTTLVAQTDESSSLAQLDGQDIVYVARVAVPKIMTITVAVGSRLPAAVTSMGRVLLAELPPDELEAWLAEETREPRADRAPVDTARLRAVLDQVRGEGWALVDEELAPGIRSVATAVRDHDEAVVAAANVCVNAAQVSVERLVGEFLPLLLTTAQAITEDFSRATRLTLVPRGRVDGEVGEHHQVAISG